jgi:hypothetical protein
MTAFILRWVTCIALTSHFSLTSPVEQADQGDIIGRITDEATKAPVAGVKVVLSCDCPVAPRQAETSDRGVYSFLGLPAGAYLVQAHVGDGRIEKTVDLAAGATVRSNFSFKLRDTETLRTITVPINHTEDGCGHCAASDNRSAWGLLLFFGLWGTNATVRRRSSPGESDR